MKVSVLIPTYNRSWGLRAALNSALEQTWHDLEVIVCDDASADDTQDVVAEFKDPRLTYFRQPKNAGMVGNWGKAIDLATGEALILLADDDVLRPSFVQSRVNAFR